MVDASMFTFHERLSTIAAGIVFLLFCNQPLAFGLSSFGQKTPVSLPTGHRGLLRCGARLLCRRNALAKSPQLQKPKARAVRINPEIFRLRPIASAA
jgi:hypothetical protein